MKHIVPSALLLASLAAAASAQTKTFTVVSGSKSQLAQVESKTEVETFTGKTSKVGGFIKYDAKKRSGSGKITVDPSDLDTGIPLRNEHLRSATWLDTAKHKAITFETTKVLHTTGDGYKVTGKFTLKGVTKTITVEATVKGVKANAETKKLGFKGDVVQLKTSFSVKLADYGITISGPATGKVSETVRISLTAYGQEG